MMRVSVTDLDRWDQFMSSILVCHSAIEPKGKLRYVLLCLEWIMHGTLWLISIVIAYLVAVQLKSPMYTIHRLTLLLIGLCFDLASVGLVKIAVRRKRPEYDVRDQVCKAPVVDRFSFPSGHTSRGAMLAVLWENLFVLPYFHAYLNRVFPLVLAISRVMIGRHYLGDIIAGLLLGIMEGFLVSLIPSSMTSYLKTVAEVMIGDNQ